MTSEIDSANQKRIDIILSGQEALVGAIVPNLRVVEVAWNDSNITLYFIYDGLFTKEDEDISKKVAYKIQQDFPDSIIEAICMQIDYPNDFPARSKENCTWLYARKEG